jgi:Notch-like protein
MLEISVKLVGISEPYCSNALLISLASHYLYSDVDECDSNPCENGGRCLDQVNRFQCECLAGYVGEQCEIDVDECESDPCRNGGTCIDQVNGFECKCMKGFAGDFCEKGP